MLPEPLLQFIAAARHEAGDASPLRAVEPVTGGYTHPSVRLVTDRGAYFLKWDEQARPGLFPAARQRYTAVGESVAPRR